VVRRGSERSMLRGPWTARTGSNRQGRRPKFSNDQGPCGILGERGNSEKKVQPRGFSKKVDERGKR